MQRIAGRTSAQAVTFNRHLGDYTRMGLTRREQPLPQVYSLSVVMNFLAGLALCGDMVATWIPSLAPLAKLREGRLRRLLIGAGASLVGLVKLFVRSPGENVAVAGDLLPSLAGIALGLMLVSDALQEEENRDRKSLARIAMVAREYRVPLGIAGVLVALLHLLLPGVLLLRRQAKGGSGRERGYDTTHREHRIPDLPYSAHRAQSPAHHLDQYPGMETGGSTGDGAGDHMLRPRAALLAHPSAAGLRGPETDSGHAG